MKRHVDTLIGRKLSFVHTDRGNLVLQFDGGENYIVRLGVRTLFGGYRLVDVVPTTALVTDSINRTITAIRYTKTYSHHGRVTYELWLQLDSPLNGKDWIIHPWHIPVKYLGKNVSLLLTPHIQGEFKPVVI